MACSDGRDNDGEGLIDAADPGCWGRLGYNPNDDDERNAPLRPECSDGIDNDGDGLVDMADPGCTGPNDNDETDGVPPPPPPPPEEDGMPTAVISLRGGYMGNNFLAGGPAFELGAGGRIGGDSNFSAWLLGYVTYNHLGTLEAMDPRSRVTEPNPNDPFATGSDVSAVDTTTGHLIGFGPALRLGLGSRFFLELGGRFYVAPMSTDKDVSEKLLFKDGTTVPDNEYTQHSSETKFLGGPTVGLGVRVSDNVGLSANCAFAFGEGSNKAYGCMGGLEFYMGGKNK
jgi:hypothetical protein